MAKLGNFIAPTPPIEEQKQIFVFINKETSLIDKTIFKAEREIELIQEYKTRLVSDVVTGKIYPHITQINADFDEINPQITQINTDFFEENDEDTTEDLPDE